MIGDSLSQSELPRLIQRNFVNFQIVADFPELSAMCQHLVGVVNTQHSATFSTEQRLDEDWLEAVLPKADPERGGQGVRNPPEKSQKYRVL